MSEDGQTVKVPSVTTICKAVIDKSDALVPWAVNETLSFLRGVLSPDADSSGSIWWEQVLEQAKKAHRVRKEEAANLGSQVHAALECKFKDGIDLPFEGVDDRVTSCYNAGLAWLETHSVQPVAVERKVYSRRYKYSGTLDKLAIVDGALSLIDWKSSKHIYPEHRLQTALYVQAYEEETGEVVQKRYLVKLGKEEALFEPHEFSRRDYVRDKAAALRAVELYRWLKECNG